ncbi:hypothetical protein [Hydrogenivirga sp.]
MAVRVRIGKSNPDVPDDFIFSVLSSVLGIGEEEFRSIKAEDGTFSLYVKDPSAIIRLQEIAEKHSSLLKIDFEKPSSGGGLFSIVNTAVKSNWGLALSWGAVVLLMIILSIVPVLGFFLNVVLSVFYYAFTLYVAHRLMSVELQEDKVREVVSKLRLSEAFSGYMAPGFGFWLGFVVLYILSAVIVVVLSLVFGGLGALSDLSTHGRVGGGVLGSLIVVFLLVMLFWLWLIYALPLMFARALSEGAPTFNTSFMAVVSVFTPSFLKESFSNAYLGVGGMWSLAMTVGIIGFVIAFAFIITIPVAFLILYWLQIFLSVSSVAYIKKA